MIGEESKFSLRDLLIFNNFYCLILGSKQNKEQNQSRVQDESMDQNDSTEQDLIIDENESMGQNDTVDEREDNVGKITKNQCEYCFETKHKDSIKRHSNLCGLYQKFVRNGSECSVCMKTFESRKELNGHIGRRHKKELNEIIKSEGMYPFFLIILSDFWQGNKIRAYFHNKLF